MDQPTLSIITVSAFEESRLTETFMSLIFESKKIELIHVLPPDDYIGMSVADSILQELNINYVRIHDNHEGIYPAMNLGVKYASGKYVIFINAGDVMLNCDRLIEVLEHPPIDSHIDALIFNAEFQWEISQNSIKSELISFVRQEPNAYISHQTIAFSRKFLLLGALFDTKYKVSADFKQIVQLSVANEIEFTNEKFVKVEFPKWSAENNLRGRIETYAICVTMLPWKSLRLATINICRREFNFAFSKAKRALQMRF